MNFKIDLNKDGKQIDINIDGEIDAFTAPKLKEAFEPYAGIKDLKVLVDLSEVTYMDSTGLGVLVGIFKNLRASNGDMTLRGLSDRLKRLFDITGLTDIMNINSEIEGGV
ncbi:STAS domain-containing protein [Heyndrickxia ginsengihumi]|uniref:Anti-sigma factor antagonist n=1 Tax=Heyndrickxia ginsengihumi TaxID=363870 RepID=A0A0A6XWT5_9BACI|nr:STAS domain-containing protein [Heyndrickxia ginsengihumi]KHD84602.1 anti-sigma B factor antagonist [Heyndrickxia ginsengihumi]MBE6184324.1 STAS domain-containing protein [Bacillus sp. (in: firmicutes)]MCM3024807.1 STAS domain-containing protein [Heyndrickxia ginsengihumi]NEY21610.1 STAS domain-containing protein [Heyndrickxia ginsengihumi]